MPEDSEEFRPVPGWPMYRVSAAARFQSSASGEWRDLKLARHCQGYRMACLTGPDGKVKKLLHRLVLEAWVGPCPPGHEACHWNDIKTDDRLDNLRWGTRTENVADAVRNGRMVLGGERHSTAKLTDAEVLEILARVRAGETQLSVAKAFGTSQPNVSGILSGVSRNDITGLPRRPAPIRSSRVA